MPRLIKLSSDNEVVADFQNFFTEDIVILPNSKVALYNLSLTLSQKVFEVNLSNYSLQAQVKGSNNGTGGLKQVLLRLGTYTQAEFLQELTRALNGSMAIVDGGIANNITSRNEWKPIYDMDKLKIQYSATTDDLNAGITFVLGTLAFNGNALGKAGTDNVWESAYTSKVFSNGVGNIFCQLVNTRNGICIGLVNDISNGGSLAPQNYYICVFIEGGVYKYCFNGTVYATTQAPSNNERIIIRQELGAFKILIGATPQTILTIATFPCLYDQILHGAVSLLMNNSSVTALAFTPSPFQNTNATGVSLVQDVNDIQDVENYIQHDSLGAPATVGTQHRIVLPEATARLLGYTTLDNVDVSQISGSFNGTEIIRFGKLPETLTIEIPSLGLEGYDADIHRRRPILAILPAGETPSVQRDYSANYPIYIDVNNKDKQLLNTIQVRILDEGGVPVNIEAGPGVVLTILLD
jgi:hypothetical protein